MPTTRAAAAPRPRRTNARGAASREALIGAAVRLFATRGFRGTGIIGLAREVGMSHVGLLHHFGTKEQLLREVVAQRDEQYRAVATDVTSRRGLDALATLRGVGETVADDPTLSRLFTVLIAENLQPDDPLNALFRERYQTIRSAFATAIVQGQEDGTIRPDVDPEPVAAGIVAFLLGIQTEHLLDPDGVDLPVAFAAYTERLLSSLALRAG